MNNLLIYQAISLLRETSIPVILSEAKDLRAIRVSQDPSLRSG